MRAPSVDGADGEPVPVVLPAGALPLADERGASCEDDVVLVEAFPLDGAGAGAADAPSPAGAVSAWSSALPASSACWSAPSVWLSAGA